MQRLLFSYDARNAAVAPPRPLPEQQVQQQPAGAGAGTGAGATPGGGGGGAETVIVFDEGIDRRHAFVVGRATRRVLTAQAVHSVGCVGGATAFFPLLVPLLGDARPEVADAVAQFPRMVAARLDGEAYAAVVSLCAAFLRAAPSSAHELTLSGAHLVLAQLVRMAPRHCLSAPLFAACVRLVAVLLGTRDAGGGGATEESDAASAAADALAWAPAPLPRRYTDLHAHFLYDLGIWGAAPPGELAGIARALAAYTTANHAVAVRSVAAHTVLDAYVRCCCGGGGAGGGAGSTAADAGTGDPVQGSVRRELRVHVAHVVRLLLTEPAPPPPAAREGFLGVGVGGGGAPVGGGGARLVSASEYGALLAFVQAQQAAPFVLEGVVPVIVDLLGAPAPAPGFWPVVARQGHHGAAFWSLLDSDSESVQLLGLRLLLMVQQRRVAAAAAAASPALAGALYSSGQSTVLARAVMRHPITLPIVSGVLCLLLNAAAAPGAGAAAPIVARELVPALWRVLVRAPPDVQLAALRQWQVLVTGDTDCAVANRDVLRGYPEWTMWLLQVALPVAGGAGGGGGGAHARLARVLSHAVDDASLREVFARLRGFLLDPAAEIEARRSAALGLIELSDTPCHADVAGLFVAVVCDQEAPLLLRRYIVGATGAAFPEAVPVFVRELALEVLATVVGGWQHVEDTIAWLWVVCGETAPAAAPPVARAASEDGRAPPPAATRVLVTNAQPPDAPRHQPASYLRPDARLFLLQVRARARSSGDAGAPPVLRLGARM